MTTTTLTRPETNELHRDQDATVLHPAELDDRDRRIILSVAKRWADSGASSYRQIECDVGMAISALHRRITGKDSRGSCFYRVGGGLIERGWLRVNASHTIRPGPRFAGMQRKAGIVYEWVN